MGWKIFAVVLAVMSTVGLAVPSNSQDSNFWLELINAPIFILTILGLIFYAFRFEQIGQKFWYYFSIALPLYWVLSIAIAIIFSAKNFDSSKFPKDMSLGIGIALAIILILGVACSYFNWLAIYRYAQPSYQADEKSPGVPRYGQTAVIRVGAMIAALTIFPLIHH